MPRSLIQRVGGMLLLFSLVIGGLLGMMLTHLMQVSLHEVWLLALVLALFAVAVLLYIAGLARRIRLLSREMEIFRASDFSQAPALQGVGGGNDELGRLAQTLEAMSQRMMQQLARIQREDQARRELIANVSHDLRTPLASMRGYLDTLLIKANSLSDEERHVYLSVAVEQANRLAHLIGELFEMAKLEAPNAAIYAEPCALAELIQDVAQKFELVAAERDIRIVLDVDLETPWVRADIGLMERILSNLLDNALRHTPGEGTVRISLKSRDGQARVEVRDSGQGIDQAQQAHIFDPFYQASTSRSGGGAGLGLSIVRRALELHGAAIQVDSQLGQGACFYFDLPWIRRAAGEEEEE